MGAIANCIGEEWCGCDVCEQAAGVTSLRAQLAAVTRERDEARASQRCVEELFEAAGVDYDTAIARAESAERERDENGRSKERAAIVKWLLEEARLGMRSFVKAADAIEAGEHEEGK